MKKAESTLINMLLSLTLIAVVAGGVLGLVSAVTAEPIENAQKQKESDAIMAVLPKGIENPTIKADTIAYKHEQSKDEQFVCFRALDADGNLLGMAIKSNSDKGFGGRLGVMFGFDAEGNVTGYQILATAETPGLGAKADTWFTTGKGNIIGKNPATDNLKVSKSPDNGTVDAISGSTITSRAFLGSLDIAYNVFTLAKGGNE